MLPDLLGVCALISFAVAIFVSEDGEENKESKRNRISKPLFVLSLGLTVMGILSILKG